MAHNTSVIATRVPNATRRRLHTLAETWHTTPAEILRVLLSALPLRTYTAEMGDALGKLLKALGLPGDATPDAIRSAVDKILGIDGGSNPDGGGGGEGLPDIADPAAPAVLSEYGRLPSAHDIERVAARVRSLSTQPTERVRDGIRPAPAPAFVMGTEGVPIVNPTRYARKAR